MASSVLRLEREADSLYLSLRRSASLTHCHFASLRRVNEHLTWEDFAGGGKVGRFLRSPGFWHCGAENPLRTRRSLASTMR